MKTNNNFNKWLIIGFLIFTFICIVRVATMEEKNHEKEEVENIINKPKKVDLKDFTEFDIAEFTMASIMYQPTKIMTTKKDGENIIVSYIRPSDSQKFSYRIKIEGHRIIWATIDGRWRDSSEDEYITFEEEKKKIIITQRFSDGSSSKDSYTK